MFIHFCIIFCNILLHYRNKDLLQFMAALRETYAPLVALGRLSTTPHLGLQHQRPQVPVQTFTLVPQSWRKVIILIRKCNKTNVPFR